MFFTRCSEAIQRVCRKPLIVANFHGGLLFEQRIIVSAHQAVHHVHAYLVNDMRHTLVSDACRTPDPAPPGWHGGSIPCLTEQLYTLFAQVVGGAAFGCACISSASRHRMTVLP